MHSNMLYLHSLQSEMYTAIAGQSAVKEAGGLNLAIRNDH